MVLPGSFGVILPDDVMICCAWLTQMAQAYTYSHGVVEMTVLEQDAPLYGICRLLDAPSGRLVGVSGIVETPKAATEPPLLADFGRHVVDPVMFSIVLGIPHSDIGEVQLPDPITVDAARVKMTALRFSGQRFVGGSHDELIGAGLARQRVVKRQRNGALFGLDAFKRQVRINDTPPSARRLDGRATALEGSAT
jgi:UTP-glucose-1-phosphate uridylyltransferase